MVKISRANQGDQVQGWAIGATTQLLINKEEGLFPSLKQNPKNSSSKGKFQKGLIIPIGATSKDMQKGNDKLQEDVRGLISTLEEQVVKMREYKRKQLELVQDKEHINDKDPG